MNNLLVVYPWMDTWRFLVILLVALGAFAAGGVMVDSDLLGSLLIGCTGIVAYLIAAPHMSEVPPLEVVPPMIALVVLIVVSGLREGIKNEQ